MSRLLLLLTLAGALLLVRGCSELRTARRADASATPRSCARLLAHGPGENAHVQLAGCRVCREAALREVSRARGTTLWVPLVPEGEPCPPAPGPGRDVPPEAAPVRLVARLAGGGAGRSDERMLTGLVLDRLTALPRPVKERFFGATYTVLGQVPGGWVVDSGATPAPRSRVAGLLAGGLALVVAGLAAPLLASRRDAAAGAAPDRDP